MVNSNWLQILDHTDHTRPYILLQGVIRDSQDLDMLGSQFKEMYRKRAVDPFDEEGWDGKH